MKNYNDFHIMEVTIPDTWETFLVASPVGGFKPRFESDHWWADQGKQTILAAREKGEKQLKEKIDNYLKELESMKEYEGTILVEIPFITKNKDGKTAAEEAFEQAVADLHFQDIVLKSYDVEERKRI